MTIRRRLAATLIRHHAALRPVLPRGHRAYPAAGGWTFLDLRESPMMLARALRAYEPAKVAALRGALRPGMVFVDVGGNKGDFSLVAAKTMGDDGRVVCVEPAPENVAWIRRSVARNGYRCIDVAPVAVAERDGEDTLYLGSKSGWHSLVHDPASAVGTLEVPIRTLDSLLAERRIDRVDVMKIDVEGAEDRVVAGATATLSTPHPMTLLVDLHPGRVDAIAVCEQLRAFGFTVSPEPGASTSEIVARRA